MNIGGSVQESGRRNPGESTVEGAVAGHEGLPEVSVRFCVEQCVIWIGGHPSVGPFGFDLVGAPPSVAEKGDEHLA